jgi:hypothetical protein
MVMHDDAHDQVLVAFNIWDVTRCFQFSLVDVPYNFALIQFY